MANALGQSDRKGISLKKLFEMFPDDETAEAWFTEQRWGDTPACPHCGSTNVLTGAQHKTMPYRCREKQCRKRFQRQNRYSHAVVQPGISDLGNRHLPADYITQERVQSQAAPGP